MTNKIIEEAVNHLLPDLRATHGANLAAVVLYGSAATGENVERGADYNLLIALHHITPEDLRLAQAPTREWQRVGHPLPVYFTVEELHGAADVFPIEFHRMEKARVVLYGDDPFASLKISDANLRHQTEYELRSKLIQLRRLYIPASVSGERMSALMRDSLTSYALLFAPVLMLHGVEPPVMKQDLVRATVRLLGLEAEPFERILELGAPGAHSLTEAEANDLFAAYLAQIERVIQAIDRLENT
jgi:predicted nucleotidyltransferase